MSTPSPQGLRYPLTDKFGTLDRGTRQSLVTMTTSLRQAMAVLYIAEHRFETKFLSADEIRDVLEDIGIDLSTRTIVNALARGGKRVVRRLVDEVMKYRLMAAGATEVQGYLEHSDIAAVYFEAGRHWSARRKLQEILSSLSGTARICDPYFGIRSLNAVEMFPQGSAIRFLTSNLTGNQTQIHQAIDDFGKERPLVEVRILPPPNSVHDRYILWDDRVILIGHGLKDIGGRESVIVSLAPDVAPGLAGALAQSFEVNWAKSVAV